MKGKMTEKQVATIKRELRKLISGKVLSREDAGYQNTVTLDNGRIRRKPLLVVMPSSTRDIAKIVRYCRQHDIRLTTKSGGHSGNGYCLNHEGVVLDLSALNVIRSHDDGARLTVGMGARWIELYNYIQSKHSDFIAVGGGCGAVGLGGFLLGGGFSFISRSHGLACDSVKRMDFVSACGDIHRLDEHVTDPHEKALLWALRGGGGGNFGIVSQVDLALHKRRSAEMLMGTVAFPIARAHEVLDFYNSWVLGLPPEMAVYGMLRRVVDPSRGGDPILSLRFSPIYNGPFLRGLDLLKPLIDKSPSEMELYAMTLPQWEAFVGQGTMINGRSAYIRSAILPPGGLNPDTTEILVRHMSQAPSRDSYIVWTHGGGNIRNDAAAEASCFAHRDAQFVFELKSIWKKNERQEALKNIEWAVAFFDELESRAQGAYLNYIDPLLENWQTKYYRTSYPPLLEVKQYWDKEGQFNFQQGIGSDFQPTRTRPLDITPLNRTYAKRDAS